MDEINKFNRPLLVIPGSHKIGEMLHLQHKSKKEIGVHILDSPGDYTDHLSAGLKNTLDQQLISNLVKENGIVSVKASPGSVLFFHSTIFNASSNNLPPWNRKTFMVKYNAARNFPSKNENPRPDFLANRNYEPIEMP